MSQTLLIQKYTDEKTTEGLTRTLQLVSPTPTTLPGGHVLPQTPFPLKLENPTAGDLVAYDVGKQVVLTIAPAPAAA